MIVMDILIDGKLDDVRVAVGSASTATDDFADSDKVKNVLGERF